MSPGQIEERRVSKTAVIKKEQVHFVASAPGASPADADQPALRAANSSQARIIESSESGALLEVQCSCGRKVQVRCNYATPASSSV